jgi:hypothetical protein
MTLNGITLPNSFRYPPFVPDKRYNLTPTATGAVYQEPAAGGVIQGDGVIDWTADLLCFDEFCVLNQLYYGTGPYEFIGQYGETYVVEFITFKAESVGGGLLNTRGSFVVRCVTDTSCGGTYY